MPFAFSSTSVTPSPSSSGSVTSGSPSLSVSLCTVISTVLVVFEPSGFVTTTGISNFLVSSLGPQSVTFGVPEIVFVTGSYVTPLGSLLSSTVTVAVGFPGVIVTLVTGFPSTTVWFGFKTVVGLTGVITAAGLELASFGFDPFAFSSTSVTPSPSSSGSVTSGSPSLSVSLCTVISTVLVVFEPSGFVTTTGISNFLVSSVGPQSVTFGVPEIVFVVGS